MEPAPQPIEIIATKEAPMPQTMFTGTPQMTGQIPHGVGIPLGMVMEKPPFSWKQFFIGAGVPTLLLLIPLLLAVSTEPYQPNYGPTEIPLSKDQGTNYSGSGLVPAGTGMDSCWISISVNPGNYYHCRIDGMSATIWLEEWEDEEYSMELVGNYSSKTGIAEFDDGSDHGAQISFSINVYDPNDSNDLNQLALELIEFMCFLSPLLALILLVVGFSTGRKGLGVGGIIGLVIYPFLGIFSLIALW